MTTINKQEMFIAFKLLGQEALAMNHYDLEAAADADYTAEEWKLFLSEPEVQDYIKKEMSIIRTSKVNKLIQSNEDKSVAKAQLLTTLQKAGEQESQKEGPIFVYCYVPLNDEQKHAPNIMEVDEFGKPKA